MFMLDQTAKLVTAYLAKNPMAVDDVPGLIRSTYSALVGVSVIEDAVPERLQPAVPVRKSVAHEAIHCLECGKQFAMLKRHLRADHGLTPGEYRAKWGLAADYPIVAPAYGEARSALAKSIGLGRKKVVEQPVETIPAPAEGRRKKLGLFKRA